MKILYIHNFYNPGGSALACLELAKAYESKHQMEFVGFLPGMMYDEFNAIGPAHIVPCDTGLNYPPDVIKGIINDFQPDLIHVFLPGHESPAYFDVLPTGIPAVCTVLCMQSAGFDMSHFNKVTFLSKANMKLSSDQTLSGIDVVVRPGLGLTSLPHPEPNEPLVFGRISAFCPSKKIHETIKCASACPDNLFIIAGEIQDQNYYQECMDMIRSYYMSCNIDIEVNITEQRKQELYDQIDVLHYPTSDEAFCYSIVEGMQRGMPVISTPNSAIPELMHKDESVLIQEDIFGTGKAETLQELTKRVASWDRNEYNRVSEIARLTYENHYTRARYAQDMHNVYDEVLEAQMNVSTNNTA